MRHAVPVLSIDGKNKRREEWREDQRVRVTGLFPTEKEYIYTNIYIIEERLISDAHLLLVSVLHGCKKKSFGIVKGWAHISCVSALA